MHYLTSAVHQRLPETSVREQFAGLPGVGAKLSQQIVEAGICTLEDLEMACWDGRLSAIPGFGEGRVAVLATELDLRLGPAPRTHPMWPRPDVGLLLEIDREYRRLAAEDNLPRIAPRRFNRNGRPWLPVLRTERDGWRLTAMFSNTAAAYVFNQRHDWVHLLYEHDGEEDACTVVTARDAHLYGRRVIRGRQEECFVFYADQAVPDEVRRWAHQMAASLPG